MLDRTNAVEFNGRQSLLDMKHFRKRRYRLVPRRIVVNVRQKIWPTAQRAVNHGVTHNNCAPKRRHLLCKEDFEYARAIQAPCAVVRVYGGPHTLRATPRAGTRQVGRQADVDGIASEANPNVLRPSGLASLYKNSCAVECLPPRVAHAPLAAAVHQRQRRTAAPVTGIRFAAAFGRGPKRQQAVGIGRICRRRHWRVCCCGRRRRLRRRGG
jgi:hypothetical protein